MTARLSLAPLALLASLFLLTQPAAAQEVVAFWGFLEDYDFDTNPNKQDFAADVDGTVAGDANLQAYLGAEDELDDNGGGGFVSYTSAASGITYAPTRTLKYDDARGGGDDFDIGGVTTFSVDKLDGAGPQDDDFGNDALVYLTLDATGFSDLQVRFDIEGDPANLPNSFDIFYRTDGPSGTWFRDPAQNNIGLSFIDHDPADPENQFADSGLVALASALDNASSVEILLTDFAENGNGEMELDNIEIIGQRVPEPAAALLLAIAGVGALARSRR